MRGFLLKKSETLRKGEMLSYAFGGFGEQLFAYFVGSFIMFYLTDYVGILPATVGIIMFIPRIWDAINDPLMGILADRTRTKYGRFRPYLFYAPMFLLITTITLYSIPSHLTYTHKLIWAFTGYFLWGMAYTALSIPNISLVSVITTDSNKRAKVISMNRFAGMLGGGIPMLFVPLILKKFSTQNNIFSFMAIGISILGFLLLLGVFFFCRERRVTSPQKPEVKKNLKLLFRNKPLLVLAVMSIMNLLIIWISSSLRIYYFKYNLGDEGLLAYFTLGLLPFNVAGMILAPQFIKRLGNMKSYISACLLRVLFSLCFFVFAKQSIYSTILWMGLIDLCLAIEGIAVVNMIVDCVDYGEYTFGVRTEGLYFSIQSFSGKFAGSLSTLITGISLTLVGYVPNVAQSDATLQGIFMVFALMPGVAALVSIVVLMLYPLKDKKMERIRHELRLREEMKV